MLRQATHLHSLLHSEALSKYGRKSRNGRRLSVGSDRKLEIKLDPLQMIADDHNTGLTSEISNE